MLQTLVDTAVLGADWLRLERPRLHRAAKKGTRRHLALFAWGLPPTSTVGVHRPLSFLRYGNRHGWRIDAFGSKAPDSLSEHGDELLARVPPETTLHVVPPASREPSYRLFPRIDGGFTNALMYAHYAIDAMASDPPDVVLASGPPFFTFVAALLVARRFGVPFVLDYRDEWTECPYDNVMKGGHNHAWEARCLREASAVLFTTESHVQHQLEKFPELDASRAHFLPNGWEPDDFAGHEPLSSTRSAESAAMRVAHIGSMPRHKSPEEFLASLRQLIIDDPEWLHRIHVQFVGRRTGPSDRAIDAFEFPSAIEVIGHVSKREANRRMQESDILLLLAGPGTERYLNAKLFDYVAARRPILAFGTHGESPAAIERLGVGVHCSPGSASALRDSLERLRALDMSQNEERVSGWLQAHRRDVLASRAFDIIESVLAPAPESS